MTCQCQRLMLGYYRDNGEPFVHVVTSVEARTDPDIQRAVDEARPASVAEQVQMEGALQARRDERWHEDADGPFQIDPPSPGAGVPMTTPVGSYCAK